MRFHKFHYISPLAAAFFLCSSVSAESGGFLEYPDYVVNWAQTKLGNNGSDSIAAFEKRSGFGLLERQETCQPGYGYCSSMFILEEKRSIVQHYILGRWEFGCFNSSQKHFIDPITTLLLF